MSIKCICIDMDGTLYNKDKVILPATIKAMKDAQKQGVNIAIISGRPVNYIMAYQKKTGLDWIMSGGNGAALYLHHQMITYPIDGSDVQKMVSLVNQYQLQIYLKTQNTIYHNYDGKKRFHYDEITKDLPAEYQMHSQYCSSLLECIRREESPFLKGIIIGNQEEDVIQCRQEIHKQMEVSTFSSEPHHFELSSKNSDKGKAVLEIANQLGIQLSEMCCIGDSDNDMPMFRVCAYPIAMENATQELKDQSFYVTRSYQQDGVGHAIRYLMKQDLLDKK